MHDCPRARCAQNATLVEYAAAASGLYVDFFGEGQRARALSQLREFAFIGLVEYWGLSACLYHARLGGPPPITVELANVRPGDLLYLPAGWVHEVHQAPGTLAVNWWFGARCDGPRWAGAELARRVGELRSAAPS